MEETARGRARIEPPDISEKGGLKDGEPQRSDDRLFVQLLAYGNCAKPLDVRDYLYKAPVENIVYEDLNDPLGIAVVMMSRQPGDFIDVMRPLLTSGPCAALQLKPEFTMTGRTYALGYEPDLNATLIERPRGNILNPDWRWGIWYPLRRSGSFVQLPVEQQRKILAEHGTIGIAYGAADYVHDVRLACHGLDRDDNDFVIGLIGKDLYPLSAVVQEMRKTQQTSLYLDRLGPFFIGRRV
jgi:hypothetical protein